MFEIERENGSRDRKFGRDREIFEIEGSRNRESPLYAINKIKTSEPTVLRAISVHPNSERLTQCRTNRASVSLILQFFVSFPKQYPSYCIQQNYPMKQRGFLTHHHVTQ